MNAPTARMTHPVWRALFLLFGLLNVARFYPVFVSETVAVGQAGFEPSHDGVLVRYGDNTDDRMSPLMVLARGDGIVVGQGNTIVVPLEDASGLSIRSADEHRAPWVLIGLEQSDVPGAPADDVRAGHRLGVPQMVSVANG